MVLLSGGTEGLTNPAMFVLTRRLARDGDRAGPALAAGRAVSPDLPAEAIGTPDQVKAVAATVRAAAADAGLDDPTDIVFALCKAPLITAEAAAETDARGSALSTRDLHASKPLTRAATALGVALATGEAAAADVTDAAIGARRDLFTARCCVTPAIDLRGVEVTAFGLSKSWRGDLTLASTAFADMADAPALHGALLACGLTGSPQLDAASRARLKLILMKGEPSRDGRIRGRRHVMWRDSDVHALRWFRASMMGLIAGQTGDTRAYIAAGAEHQGPPGGGCLAVFAERGAV